MTELYPDSLYKFYIVSVSEGGASDVSVTEINTGDPQVSVVAQSIQSQPLDQPGKISNGPRTYLFDFGLTITSVSRSIVVDVEIYP